MTSLRSTALRSRCKAGSGCRARDTGLVDGRGSRRCTPGIAPPGRGLSLFGDTNSAAGPRNSRAHPKLLNATPFGRIVERPSVSFQISSVQYTIG